MCSSTCAIAGPCPAMSVSCRRDADDCNLDPHLLPGDRARDPAGRDRAVSDLEPRAHGAVPDAVRLERAGRRAVAVGVLLAGVRRDAARRQRARAAVLLPPRLGADRAGVLPHAVHAPRADAHRAAGVADRHRQHPGRGDRDGARAPAAHAHREAGDRGDLPDGQRLRAVRRGVVSPPRAGARTGRSKRAPSPTAGANWTRWSIARRS